MRSVGKVLVIFSFLSICFNPTLELSSASDVPPLPLLVARKLHQRVDKALDELRGNGENEPSLLDVMKGRVGNR
ncbi:hypothetical protein NECAME_03103 [Necator americanus]|uniref:Uncharacterized protein n=1 Tax=Necator americanus TaxID=51031 RepID=W2T6P7_NECAM|nr:hypothetical protein NECAME_03103 [Necator americanus]ETN77685.1 hypothetical protein NECAME_03103 [Necator americanus]